jgi:HEAT repeat protein
VALKVLRRGVKADRQVLTRFLKTSTDHIRHPNLWSLESIGETADGSIYYSMPIYGGDSLEHIIADLGRGFTKKPSLSPLSLGPNGELHPRFQKHALELVSSAAEGLARAHREGILHRRLSPRNLFLTPAGRLVIADFGGSPSRDGSALIYSAPEELEAYQEQDIAGAPGDVYSLGVILYLLFLHRRPFAEENSKELKRAILRGRFPAPRSLDPSIPREVETFILKAMSLDPLERHPDAGEAARDLESCLDRLRGGRTSSTTSSSAGRGLGEGTIAATVTGRETNKADNTAGEVEGRAALFSLQRFGAPRYRAVIASTLFLFLICAWVGGRGLYLQRKKEEHGAQTLALLQKGEYSLALEETRRLESLDPGDRSLPLLLSYAKSRATVSSLQQAVKALCEVNFPEAKSALEEASRLERGNPFHESATERLVEGLSFHPLERDLGSDDPHRRAAALTQLYLDISSGARPRDDARLGARALHSGDPEVDRRAIETLALFGASWPILDGLHIGTGTPSVTLDAGAFLSLYDALERIFDEDASRILCGWDLEVCERMDRRERGEVSLKAPPNLMVDFKDDSSRDFTVRWIRAAARLDPPGLARSAAHLSVIQGLVPELVSALGLAGTPEAKEAILRLVLESHLSGADGALQALSRLGACQHLLEVVRSDRPLPLRERALSLLGEDGALSSLADLRTVALTSPEPSLRRLAFRTLSLVDDPAAVAVIPLAVDDQELKEAALHWLGRLPIESSEAVLLELLGHPDHRVRSKAVLLLSAPRAAFTKEDIRKTLLPLSRRLFSPERETREAALAVIFSRGGLARLVEACKGFWEASWR